MKIDFQQIIFGSADYEKMVQLRLAELRKPIGLQFTADDLKKDEHDFLLIGKHNAEIICCCILTDLQNRIFKLRQMAVKKTSQKIGIGQQMIAFAEEFSLQKNATKIEMNARKYAVGFYEKMGYKIVSNEFLEVGIAHFKMERKISV